MASTIPPAQLEYYEKHASDNRRPEMIATLVCSLAITYPTVALRFWAKKYSTASIGIDDWLMLIALVREFDGPDWTYPWNIQRS